MNPNEVKFRLLGKKVDPQFYLSIASKEGSAIHFGQSGEDVILFRLLGFKKNGFYIDIGAYHPRIYSNTYLLHTLLGWRGINIDASRDAIEIFKKERPNDINLHAAISDQEGQTIYWRFSDSARNTISKENVQRQLNRGDTVLRGEETVISRRLDSILNEYLNENTQIDLMNIDVEGSELQVLMSNNWNKYVPGIILIEDYVIKDRGIEYSKIYKYLSEKGYMLISHCFDTSIYINRNYNFERIRKSDFDLSNFLNNSNELDIVLLRKERFEAESQLKKMLMDNFAFITNEIQARIRKNQHLIKELIEKNQSMLALMESKQKQYEILKQENKNLILKRNKAKNEFMDLIESTSWKVTSPFRWLKKMLEGEI